jgi:L-rhamnonate dehydratase
VAVKEPSDGVPARFAEDPTPVTGVAAAAVTEVRATRLVAARNADDLDASGHTLLVEVQDEMGRVGIGEADTSSAAAHAVVTMTDEQRWNQGLGALLLGEDPVQIESLWHKLATATSYQGPSGIARHALAAIDIALHDLAGKQLGRPAFHLLGGARRPSLIPYATAYVGLEPHSTLSQLMDDTLTQMQRARDLGFRAMKMEVVFEHLASDRSLIDCIRQGRAAIGDEVELLVDFGYRWLDWRDAYWVLGRVEDCRIWLAEATLPHHDLESHARLAARVHTRIGGAEFATTFEECRAWLEIGRVDVLQPDVTRCGGLTEMRRVAQMAAMHGASVVPHCWKTGINAAAARHLQAATPNVPFIEMLTPQLFPSPLRADLVAPEPQLIDGRLALPEAPGLGVELDRRTVQRYAV